VETIGEREREREKERVEPKRQNRSET